MFFSLVIIAMSFMPVFTLGEQAGRLFKPLAFAKTYSMATAAILAITLVPMLMACFIRGRITPKHANPVNRVLTTPYRPLVNFVVNKPWLVVLFSVAVMLVSIWPASRLGPEFMPPMDEGDLMYMPSLRPGVSVNEALQVMRQADKLIMSVPEVKSVDGKMGRAQTDTDPAPLSMNESIIHPSGALASLGPTSALKTARR